MSEDPESRLRDYLENCRIPLSRDDWAGFFKELDVLKVRRDYVDWIERKQKWFEWLAKKGLFEERVKHSLILALHQITELRGKVRAHELFWKEGGQDGLDKTVNEWWELHQQQEAKKKRDLKPTVPGVTKNWLEPMPIFNEGEPCGYVQATGQRRKRLESFLRSIRAKPTTALAKNQRGKPKHIFGFETNCRVLDQWLGNWCDQRPGQKYEVILKEALILANAVANSKSPVNEEWLAKLKEILRTNVKHAAKQIDADSDFIFLCCRATCISEIKRLNESLPKPRDERPFKERFSDYVVKCLAGEPSEYPLP
jgi:hypothetical protein